MKGDKKSILLEKLTILGFKSIKELVDFKLSRLNVLIGGNGVGKSNFIDFFRLISAMMKSDGLKEFIAKSADSYLFGGPKLTPHIAVKLKVGENGYEFELAPTADEDFIINNEKRHWYRSDKPATRNFGSGNFDSGLINAKNKKSYHGGEHGADWYTFEAINSWTVYHFHDTSKEAGVRRFHDCINNENLLKDGSNIAPYLLELQTRHIDIYNEIVNTIRLITPFFDDFILKPNEKEKVRLVWRQKGLNNYPMRPDHLSDGSIRFICLTTALLQPDPPSTIIIDEPELGLHPAAISLLAELIQDATKRTQIIVATQSPLLINNFNVEDIIVANREAGASIFKRLNKKYFSSWLENYSIGELWTKNVISGGPVHE